MVHTRHKRDVEASSPPIFLTLMDRKSRKGRPDIGDFDGHESDHSANSPRNDHSVFEEKIVESRLRPRTGPSRSYNYVFADSSDDEMTSRRHSQMLDEEEYGTPSRKAHQRRIHSSDEEDVKERSDWRRIKNKEIEETKKQRKKAKREPVEESDDDDEHDENGEHQEEHDDDIDYNNEDDVNNSAVRRSSRLRKKPYRFRGSASRQQKDDANEGNDTGKKRHYDDQDNSGEEFEDMYSRVKRPRTKRNDGTQEENSGSASASEESQDEKIESGDETQERRSYSLREHKPRTQHYIAPAIESKKRTKNAIFHQDSPPRSQFSKKVSYSPAQRKPGTRKRAAFHGSGSSTSSDSESDSGTETSDEQRFTRRKAKSMVKARARICPLNFTPEMIASSHVMKDRVRTGASLADVDPMEIDKSVTFDNVGGLQEHIMKLKEMVVFPLLYPEFYERFKVAPSRGVLFYGPPGTGKTLVARALANECSKGTQKVAFFMRKGADCLSKWVGEAERQLRLLFDKAYEMRPSIIFFDEIDGLAPVRSSRQDQIHSSIVSTLLALMDGIDARGEIVVIGATNRIDSIDPALRRPGRFDREFHFPLPSLMDRKNILKIHTKEWNPALRDDFLLELAEKCAGYCGADVKCLVTEATQNALRRRYPQIYTTSDKLQLDISSITLNASDFARAITNIVPAAQRAVPNPASALELSVRPLLTAALTRLEKALASRFPCSRLNGRTGNGSNDSVGLIMDLPADEDENAPSIFMPVSRGNKAPTSQSTGSVSQSTGSVSYLKFASSLSNLPAVFRPRMLVSGAAGQGQTVHLAPAALHLMEHLPVHALNSATLFAASAKMPEEACANVFHEAKRTAPSIIFIPYINELWGVINDCMRVTFLTMVRSVSPSTPILMLATSEVPYLELDDQLRSLFSISGGEVVDVGYPTKEERHKFFHDLIMCQTIQAPPTHKQAARRVLEPLAKAPPPEPRKLSEKELKQLYEQEELTLREMRIFLRDIAKRLGSDSRFKLFTKPVDEEEVPDYYDIIKKPMDLSKVVSKLDTHQYNTAHEFLADIILICKNALEYNPDRGPYDRGIRHRACALKDTAESILANELDPDFERLCQEIDKSRQIRGVDSSQSVPAFYHTRPLAKSSNGTTDTNQKAAPVPSPPLVPEGCRYSRRVRGLDADRQASVRAVEKKAHLEDPHVINDMAESMVNGELLSEKDKPTQDNEEELQEGNKKAENQNNCSSVSDKHTHFAKKDCMCPSSSGKKPTSIHSGKSSKGSSESKHTSASKKASIRKRCPWLTTRRRRRHYSTSSHHRQVLGSPAEVEVVTDNESNDTPTKPSKHEEGWDRQSLDRRDDHSNQSASNTASVNIPNSSHTRTSTENIPESQNQNPEEASRETPKQKGAVSLQEKASVVSKPLKIGAARNLDLDLIAVAHVGPPDSGVDSNGDSRDSLDQNNSNGDNTTKNHEHMDDDATPSTSTAGLSMHGTRSRTQNSLQMSALAALESENGQVLVDKAQLSSLLVKTVAKTEGFTVEKLQHLYSVLSCSIYNHRYQLDKAQLLQEMGAAVEMAYKDTGHSH